MQPSVVGFPCYVVSECQVIYTGPPEIQRAAACKLLDCGSVVWNMSKIRKNIQM